MMIKLMTWFIELQNKFNESRLSKILMIYVLNWNDDLTSWHLTWIARRLLSAYVKHYINKCCKTLMIMQVSNALTDKKFT